MRSTRSTKTIAIGFLFTAGCTGTISQLGGDVDAAPGGNPDGHAPHDGSLANPDGASNPDGAMLPCKNQVTAGLVSGHHNPGMDCMDNCHNHGFTLAGTLYSAAGVAVQGGSITVKEANGQTFDIVSGTNGNFYTSQSVSFPVTVIASECPSAQAMTATIPANQGCNSTACHASGSAQGRIHL